MAEITKETTAIVARNIRLEQELRRMNAENAMLREQLERSRAKAQSGAKYRHKYFAMHMSGWDRKIWHRELRADIGKAGLVMLGLLGVAWLVQAIAMRVWGLA